MSCMDCVFRVIYQDMGASCDVCNLQSDLADAIKACKNSADCHHRFTVAEARKIVIEREGGLPTFLSEEMMIPKEKTKPSEEADPFKTISDGLAEVAKSAYDAVISLREFLINLSTESENER